MTRRPAGRAGGRPRTHPAAEMPRPGTRRVATLGLALGIALAGSALPGSPVASAAPSEDGATDSSSAEPLRITVGRLEPRTVTPGAVVELSGTLVNDSTETWTDLSVRLQRGDLLTTRAGLAADVTAPSDATTVVAPFLDLDGELAPGGRREFTYTTTAEALGLSTDGVYPLLVNVNGAQPDGDVERVGELATHLVVQAPENPLRTSVAWLWPITDVPHRDASGAFTDDDLADAVADGGRLDRVVETLELLPPLPGADPGETQPAVPVTLAVDPALLEELAVMADGPYVAGGEAGTGTADAAELLDRLRSLATEHEVAALPYADVDGDALVEAGLSAVLTRALPGTPEGTAHQPAAADGIATATPAAGTTPSTDPGPAADDSPDTGAGAEIVERVLDVEPRTDLAWPAGGTVRADTLDVLQQGGAATVVLAEAALTEGSTAVGAEGDPASARGSLGTAGGDITTLVADDRLGDAVAGATPGSGVGRLAEQRFLAELQVLTTQLADAAPGTRQDVLVVPPRQVDPDPVAVAAMLADTANEPWLNPVPVAALAEGPAPAVAGELVPGAEALLPAEGMRGLVLSAHVRDDFAAAVADPGTVLAGYDAALARAASAQWRDDPAGFSSAVGELRETMDQLRGQVSLLAPVDGTYSLASSNAPLVLTVQNDLPFAVKVRLDLQTRGVVGLTTEDIGVQTLEPLSRTTLQVPTEVRQSGGFAVSALLTTPGGIPLGDAVQMQVKSTAYGPITLALTIGAAALLGLLFLRRGVLFVLKRRRGEPAEDPAVDGGAVAPARSPV